MKSPLTLNAKAAVFGLDQVLVDASTAMTYGTVAMTRKLGARPTYQVGDNRGRMWPSDFRNLIPGVTQDDIRSLQDDKELHAISLVRNFTQAVTPKLTIASPVRGLPNEQWAICTDCMVDTVNAYLRAIELTAPRSVVTREESPGLQLNSSGLECSFAKLGVAPSDGLFFASSKPALDAAAKLGVRAIALGSASKFRNHPAVIASYSTLPAGALGFNPSTSEIELTIG